MKIMMTNIANKGKCSGGNNEIQLCLIGIPAVEEVLCLETIVPEFNIIIVG